MFGNNRREIVFCSLLASPLYYEWSERQESVQASRKGHRKVELSYLIHFCFAQMKWNTLGWKMTRRQLILIDDIPGWPTMNACHAFRDTILVEIRILWLLLSKAQNKIELWLQTISEDCVAVFFTIQFGSQPHRMYKRAKQKAEKGLLGKYYDTKSYLCPKNRRLSRRLNH